MIRISPGTAAHVEGVYVERRTTIVAEMTRDVSRMIADEANGSYALAMPIVAHLLKEHVEWDRDDLVKILTFVLLELARIHDGHPIVTKDGGSSPEKSSPEEKRLHDVTRGDLLNLIDEAARRIVQGEKPHVMARGLAATLASRPASETRGLAGVAALAIVEAARRQVSYVDPS